MKLMIHDLNQQEFTSLQVIQDLHTKVISDNGTIHHCIGCFGCWIKTPGTCVIKDGYQNMGELLSKCDELIIISKCIYGSYSPFIRNILDRSIPYLLPYFTTINGETHHQQRYDHKFHLLVHFYGNDILAAEKTTAKTLVAANSTNFYSLGNQVYFHDNLHSIKEALQ
jgi:multimeric flavodoxin WrbA